MKEQQKRELVRKRYTFRGCNATVGGYEMPWATVTEIAPGLPMYRVEWHEIQRAADADGVIECVSIAHGNWAGMPRCKEGCCRGTGDVPLGYKLTAVDPLREYVP